MFPVLRTDGVLTVAKNPMGMVISKVKRGSPAHTAGLRPGDRVVGVGTGPARDCIDLMYNADEEGTTLAILRDEREFTVELPGSGGFGMEFEPMEPMVCGNRCVFCFIDQNPPDMRPSIYVKDEDYRLSFLHGSYVTLTNLSMEDLTRIIRQRLSPLYISVHATDAAARMKLLGIKRPDRMLEKMKRLLSAGIQMHTQIVVCPGINDGAVLTRTIADLRRLSPNVLSVAVVPVGLTRHREGLAPLTPVGKDQARAVVGLVDAFHGQFAEEDGAGFVYCADEWYLRAGLPVPEDAYYDDYPQIENGVGMVRQFLDSAKDVGKRLARRRHRTGTFVLVTGTSMGPLLEDFARTVSNVTGIEARAVAVPNRFYGETVTVSGLLTGCDILAALAGKVAPDETVVLPPNCLNEDSLFLDNMTPDGLSQALGATVIQGGYDPAEAFLP